MQQIYSTWRKQILLLLLVSFSAYHSLAQCSLSINVSVGECRFNETTNQSQVLVAVEAEWSNEPAGQLIQITFQNVTQTINPATDGCPAYVQYIVPANGTSGTVTARFSGNTCIATPKPYTLPAACPAPPACGASTTLGGRAFNDFDSDGIRDASEFGMSGITVKVYNCTGTEICSTVTGQNGRWTCTGLTAGEPVRVEFTNYPSGFNPSGAGIDNTGGSVQFTTVGDCTVNFGVNDPSAFCEDNPYLVIPCYINGNPLVSGTSANADVLVAVPYGAPDRSNTSNSYLARASEIGSVWGAAYRKSTKTLFSAAMLKRHSGWGPGGLGAIYATNLAQVPPASPTGNTSIFVNLDNYSINTGSEASITRNLPNAVGTPSYDAQAFDLVGKVGLGGLDLSDDQNTLYTVNLNSRSLVRIGLGATAAAPPTSVMEFSIPNPGCSNASDWRPWGVKFYKGKVYVGGVCSAQSTRTVLLPKGDRNQLSATIYEFNPTLMLFTEILSFPLDYPKGSSTKFLGSSDPTVAKQWNPWTDLFSDVIASGRELSYPQPMLSDIEFDVYGNMMIAFMDRTGHQVGWYNYGTSSALTGTQTYKGNSGGDVLRVYNNNGTWLLEQNARAGYDTSIGANTNQGPCGGEFYYQDAFGSSHEETASGGIAIHPSNNELLLDVMDPFNAYSAGLAWYNNATGAANRRYQVYVSGNSGTTGLFGKAAGLGDIELLCGDPTLEIGNYVWEDTDKDGVQDACEPGIAGVRVNLYNASGTQIATTTTSSTGEYYFKTSNGVTPNTTYYITFGNNQTTNGGLSVNNKTYTPTVGNVSGGANADFIDSDPSQTGLSNGLPGSIPNGLPFLTYTTGSAGMNNHTLDAGFIVRTFDLAFTKTINTVATIAPYVPGSLINFTFTVINQGDIDATNIQITDYIPTDMTLNDASWTLSGTTATLSAPIASLAAGASTTRSITLQIKPEFMGSQVTNFAEISAAGNLFNAKDKDSTPDANNTNDAGGRAGSAADNAINGTGTGTPGDTNAATDEDDHDSEQVPVQQVFDLALRQTLSAATPGPFTPGSLVTFSIEVFNQGRITGTNIQLTNYIPTGLTLNDPNWTQTGNVATLKTPITSILPNASAIRTITFSINSNFEGATIRNWAEISSAANALTLLDVDSTPDGINFNQPGETNDLNDDNVINQDGKNGGDEDDHDPTEITVVQTFDLALRKTLSPTTQQPFEVNDPVRFVIEIFNQGTITATNIVITDYIPSGLILAGGGMGQWMQSGSNATLTTPIASLAPGASTTVEINFTLDPNFTGTQIVNYAEISSASNALGLPDKDSAPDALNNNDRGGQPKSPADNFINGNGTGAIGGGVALTDEDDHDPELILAGTFFDLALRKTLSTPGTLTPGSLVTFSIEIINQGSIAASNIHIVDYIPSLATLEDPNWTPGMSGTTAVARRNTPIPTLASGASITVTITLRIRNDVPGGTLINYAEISSASNALNLPDIDSRFDENLVNDGGGQPNSDSDNSINGTGTGTFGDANAATDEDDHDPATASFGTVFDLALRKVLNPTIPTNVPPFEPGESISFAIGVVNQGTVTATNIFVSDYIPNGLILNDPNWTANMAGTVATLSAPIASLPAGGVQILFINFTISPSFMGSQLVNYAEISSAGNAMSLLDVDSTPDALNNNDAGGQPSSPADDYFGGNGTGAIGSGAALTDEDDHDPTLVAITQRFDLALRKQVVGSGPFVPGGNVTFNIDIFNQGTLDATNVQINDNIPAGLQLNDNRWVINPATGNATLVTPIPSIPAGGSTTVQIVFQIQAGFEGTSITNFAEILSANNALNLADIDSRPDAIGNNDAGGRAGSASDNALNGNGTGAPGATDATTDEDDHDAEAIPITQTFDLALRQRLSNIPAGPYVPGSQVTFVIDVFNQGTLAAQNIQITNYIPTGLVLNDPNWVQQGNLAVWKDPVPILAAGANASVTITFNVDVNFMGQSIRNWAEISSATNSLGLADVDSTPDGINFNQTGETDDLNDDDDLNDPTDEDDHDPAEVPITQTFDLALRKQVSSVGSFVPGSNVTFTIEVFNQGTLDATNIVVNDYIPNGLTLQDANWSAPSSGRTTRTIPSLAAGASTTLTITYQINTNFTGAQIVNVAEIASAQNALNLADKDSQADNISNNDADGRAGSAADDAIGGNGSGTAGGTNATTDEDDHDPALVTVTQTFDLALRKTLNTSATPGPFQQGSAVTFTIEIFNQGTLPAFNIQITDYIPEGLSLNDANWIADNDTATLNTPISSLAPGASTTVTISFNIENTFQGTSLRNWAEISSASNPLNLQDIDSTPDTLNFNSEGEVNGFINDNVIDQNGKQDGDEDDHDPAEIEVQQTFDLALRKTLSPSTQPPFNPGDDVTFILTVFNQGTVDATQVGMNDYIPTGLTLNDSDWLDLDGIATMNLLIPVVPAGGSASVEISFTLDNDVAIGAEIINYAEIGEYAKGFDDIDSNADSDNANDAGGNPDSPADDYINGDGTGTTGDGVAATDEDDHDSEAILVGTFFDLALRKTLSSAGPFEPGDLVTFTIEVINQSTVDATSVSLVDYIPSYVTLEDTDWTMSGTPDPNGFQYATLDVPFSLAAGASTTRDITFRINLSAPGGTLLNFAEISSASNALNLPDFDSSPDINLVNDGGGVPGGLTDNYLDGKGGALFGTDNPLTDEDDHDPATASFGAAFDLGIQTIIDPTPGANNPPFTPGETVQFAMAVLNQGTITATNVQVNDYIPAGMTLAADETNWTETSPGIATLNTPIASIAPGSFQILFIRLTIDPDFMGDQLVNYVEVASALGDMGQAVTDIDSNPDNNNTNDAGGQPNSAADNNLIGNGTGTPGDGVAATDEDDHDPAFVPVTQTFDLALRKSLASAGTYRPGDDVTFNIQIFNQGTLNATNIQISDDIPLGLSLNDSDWEDLDNDGIATLVTPIASLAAGTSITVPITFTIDANFEGRNAVNAAEISAAQNALNLPDIDSQSDNIVGNDAGGRVNTAADDAINGNGTGTSGSTSALTDEDDQDPSEVLITQTFDVALRQTLLTAGPFVPGSVLTFQFEVFNQGTLTANNIQISDYIPTGLILNDADWMEDLNGIATLVNPISTLAPGASVTVDITFTVDLGFQGTTIRNWGEISSASNALSLLDVDSTPDGINFNQTGETDDLNDDNDINDPTDEDDHDPEQITVVQTFDLALRQTLNALPDAVFEPGDAVMFTIKVFNQGTLDATNIQISDYIPTGLTLNDGNWTAVGGIATLNSLIPALAVGDSAAVNITFMINANYQGDRIRNWAEISSAGNALGQLDVDSTPDGINFNQTGETDDLNDDNVINQDGKNGGDEDDHDPAEVPVQQIFDLALRKTLSSSSLEPFRSGDAVTFTIEIFNQGRLDASNIQISDYIPGGLTLADPAWSETNGIVTLMVPISSLAAGASTSVDITFTVNAGFQGNRIRNWAEISSASNALNLDDFDSTPDGTNFNQTGETNDLNDDNVINQNGKLGGDEDDHDPVEVLVLQTFDLALLGSIGNYIWLDENSDGLQDAGEPGMPNVQINLKNANGMVIATTYTDNNGKYVFPNLTAGTYFVDVVEATLPNGVTQTTEFTNSLDNVPSNANQEGDLGNKDQSQLNGYQVILSGGEENLTADFGYNYNPSSNVNDGTNTAALGDRVWLDWNGNGVQDANEMGVSGVTVTLTGAGADGIFGNGDDISQNTITNSNGYYLFDNLTSGAYTVMIMSSAGASHDILTFGQYLQTGDPDHFADLAANAPTGTAADNKATRPIILAPGDVFLNADFGYQPTGAQLGSIGNTIWLDADAEGNGPSSVNGDAFNGLGNQNDTNELPIAGVTVALIRDLNENGIWDIGEPIIATAVTNANGQYLFEGLPITDGTGTDDYLVWVNDAENVLYGLKPTYDADAGNVAANSGAPTGIASSTRLGISAVSNLTAMTVTNQDFGFTPSAQDAGEGLIGDYVWLDANRDGVQDQNEFGIEGVLVELYNLGSDNAIGGVGVNADVLIATTRTDENGYYAFGGLFVDADGEGYQVKIATSNFNAGQVLQGLENTFDPDNGAADPNDHMGGVVSLNSSNPINLNQDFGYAVDNANPALVGSIGNLIWEDTDADGFKDANEMGIAGVTLALYRDLNGDGQINPGEPLFGTTTTDANGMYLFSELPLGDYIVDVTDKANILIGYWHSLGNQLSTFDNYSKSDAYAVTLDAGNPNNLNVDFGYYKNPASVGNYVWLDLNYDGLQNDGETGINGIQVTLMIIYPNGTMVTVVTTTVNDAFGNPGFYEFPNLLLDEDYNGDGIGSEAIHTIKVNLSQSTVVNYATTILNVNSNGNDQEDADDPAGVLAMPVQGNQNTGAIDPATNENAVASYDFGFTVLDFGDLPTSYGTAAAIIGNIDANNDGIPDGMNGTVWAGLYVDEESVQAFSNNADGDNVATSSDSGNDEDGLEFPNATTLITGQTYNFIVKTNSNSTSDITRYYALWFDWNNNGDFTDAGEYYPDEVTGTGSVPEVKAITIPDDVAIGTMPAIRLVVSANQVPNTPAAIFANGEIEDYFSTAPLPIELLDFSATPVDNEKVRLDWSTTSETNNAYFSVQRSSNGVDWEEIGQVEGASNSNQLRNYLFWDNEPFVGINYYRLQQFDLDGGYTFSSIVAALIEGKGQFSALLHPNPSADKFYLQLSGGKSKRYKIAIFNSIGKPMQAEITEDTAGSGNYSIDAYAYPSGSYYVSIVDEKGNVIETIKLIKK